MGTRNLVAVYIDGKYKVAQYGQWDGYPDGQGITVLHFLREQMNADVFRQALRNSSYMRHENLIDLWKSYGMDVNGVISTENYEKLKCDYPQFSRDTGAEILQFIQSHPEGVVLEDHIKFAADSLFCEWAWIIDFDTGTFEAYKGFNETHELTRDDRFYFLKDYESDSYHCITLLAQWSLDNLPTDEDFLATFETEDEEEDYDD